MDAQCWCRSLGAIHLSELHFQYLHGLVPQGTSKDIHRHRMMFTEDDFHESIRLPCPLPYQHEGLWLLELVQDVEVHCTGSCQNDMSEECWRSHPQELSSSFSSGSTSSCVCITLCLWISLFVPCGTNPCRYWSGTHSNGLLQMIYINIEHPHLQHLHEVIIDKTQG